MGKGKKIHPAGKGGKGGRIGIEDAVRDVSRKKEEREYKKALKKKDRAKFGAAEEQQYEAQMAALGCKIKEMTADGNCLFRSLADQLEGRPNKHGEYRHAVMNYIEEHSDDFAPFMEEDEPFDDYVTRLRQEKEWGGHQELVAASRLYQVNIVVHQLQAPRLEIHSDGATRSVHLSYHGEAHYNSVRAVDDFGTEGEPPKPIGQLQPRPPAAATNDKEAKEEKKRRKQVAQSVPWALEAEVEKALSEARGDVHAAVEALVSQQSTGEPSDGGGGSGVAANPVSLPDPSSSTEGGPSGVEPEDGEDGGEVGAAEEGDAASKKNRSKRPNDVRKKAQPSGHCPCGSGKKYRKCCRQAVRTKEALKAVDKTPSDAAAAMDTVDDRLKAIVI